MCKRIGSEELPVSAGTHLCERDGCEEIGLPPEIKEGETQEDANRWMCETLDYAIKEAEMKSRKRQDEFENSSVVVAKMMKRNKEPLF